MVVKCLNPYKKNWVKGFLQICRAPQRPWSHLISRNKWTVEKHKLSKLSCHKSPIWLHMDHIFKHIFFFQASFSLKRLAHKRTSWKPIPKVVFFCPIGPPVAKAPEMREVIEMWIFWAGDHWVCQRHQHKFNAYMQICNLQMWYDIADVRLIIDVPSSKKENLQAH